jgi:recombination associated protein RdgC
MHVWIDPVNGWLAIDSANAARSEEALELLHKTVDDLVLTPLRVNQSPLAAMTAWLADNEAPAGFSVDLDAELRATGEGKATVRYVSHALDAEEVRRHIASGKQCTRLALTWRDRVSFVLTHELALKRLAFLDVVKEDAGSSAGSAEEQFAADFVLMTGELSRLLADLLEALGGEEQRQ